MPFVADAAYRSKEAHIGTLLLLNKPRMGGAIPFIT
jgi:hypothetical protein